MKRERPTELEKIAYDCRQATFLIEKKQEAILNSKEQAELNIHLSGCYLCRLYEQQSLLISTMMNKMSSGTGQGIRLDETFKTTLKQQIKERLEQR